MSSPGGFSAILGAVLQAAPRRRSAGIDDCGANAVTHASATMRNAERNIGSRFCYCAPPENLTSIVVVASLKETPIGTRWSGAFLKEGLKIHSFFSGNSGKTKTKFVVKLIRVPLIKES